DYYCLSYDNNLSADFF
nr:immunoglobulin light chain junction region [Macaca mulatta]MOW36009.1 immunoglobulin light chain junction region [Macaca mulatta]MOW36059.1 immunoglobulin light chain junction region [Macaca mulatta]MOW36096.1 immunoglobulin light chain junction region [Macaca mulatta]MOW36431.1 immunoglobulin light chain junction region [Macaca mulatta]